MRLTCQNRAKVEKFLTEAMARARFAAVTFSIFLAFGAQAKEKRNFWYDQSDLLTVECENLLKTVIRETRIELLQRKADILPDLEYWGRGYYGKATADLATSKLKAVDDRFVKLIVDPGIVFRMDDFIAFVKKQNLADLDPWLARQRFRNALGNATVYRAVAIDEISASEIKKVGMKSILLRDSGFLHEFYHFDNGVPLSRTSSISLPEQIRIRMAGENSYWKPRSSVISVSFDAEIAQAVAFGFLTPGKRVFLAELSIPILDLISPRFALTVLGSTKDDKEWLTSQFIAAPVNQPMRRINDVEKVESFVPYLIQPEEIVSFQPVDINEIGYIGRKKAGTDEILECYGRCP